MTLSSFGNLFRESDPLRFMQAHDGLSALIADEACAVVGGQPVDFDGIWLSSFADSTARGLPDQSVVSIESRLATAADVLRMTRKPVLFDGENGGNTGELCALVRCLEDLGVSGVVLEDKVGPKLNSLLPDATHYLDDPACFAAKILEACHARRSPEFAIVARIESLIAGTGLDDALHRATQYVEAGADGILIHSKEEVPADLFAFAAAFPAIASGALVPPFLACVPTTYSQVTDAELQRRGFKVVIHGNQMIRAAYSAMLTSARSVLANDRSLEADGATASVMTISEHLARRDLPVSTSVPKASS